MVPLLGSAVAGVDNHKEQLQHPLEPNAQTALVGSHQTLVAGSNVKSER